MLLLNPREVTFGTELWRDVEAVAVDRAATRETVEWTDLGPHAAFADVPEQRVSVTVRQHVTGDAIGSPRPGDRAELVFHTAPSGADLPRTRVRADCCVVAVSHELSLKGGASRTVRLVALSPDGAADPVVTEEWGAA